MARQQKLIHLHGTSPLSKEAAANVQMVAGELAVMNGTQENSELYVLTTDGDIATFVTGAKVASQIQTAVKAEEDRAVAVEAVLQGEIDAAEGRITTLENKFTGEDSVAAQIAAAVKEEADRAQEVEKNLQDAIDAIEEDYLKEADKTELQDAIDGKVAQNDYDTKVAALEQADNTNAAAIKVISDDYLKGTDRTALEGQIATKVAQTDYDTKVAELEQDIEINATAIKTLEEAGYVKTVSVQNSGKNLITATEGADGTVTLNFDNMVIDCGTY